MYVRIWATQLRRPNGSKEVVSDGRCFQAAYGWQYDRCALQKSHICQQNSPVATTFLADGDNRKRKGQAYSMVHKVDDIINC